MKKHSQVTLALIRLGKRVDAPAGFRWAIERSGSPRRPRLSIVQDRGRACGQERYISPRLPNREFVQWVDAFIDGAEFAEIAACWIVKEGGA